MKDILVLGKVKALERANAADLIVLDAPAAGHAVSFLMSARGLLDAVDDDRASVHAVVADVRQVNATLLRVGARTSGNVFPVDCARARDVERSEIFARRAHGEKACGVARVVVHVENTFV